MADFGEQNRKINFFNWRTRKMKERIVWLMIMVMCLVGYAQAQRCIIIHNPDPKDNGGPVVALQTLMETLFGVGEVEQVYSNNWQRCQGAEQDALNAAELVIITRRMSSDQFRTRADRSGVPNRWWDLDTPVITLSGYPCRDSRWNYASSSTVSDYTSAAVDVLVPDHPFLEGTTGYPTATSVTVNTLPWRGDPITGNLISIAEVICDSGGLPVLVHFPGSGVAGVEDHPRSDFVEFAIGADTTSGGMDRGQYKRQTADCDQIMVNIAKAFVPSLAPDFNPAPKVDAGPDQFIYVGGTAQLDGSASDEGPSDGVSEGSPGGVTSLYWYQESGPGTATFTPAGGVDELAPTVTFTAKGVYELMLQVSDGFKDSNDIVTVTVKDHADEFAVGYWPLDGDALDASINSNDGTLEGMEGVPDGMPTYSTDAAIGTHSIDLTDRLGLNAIDNMDPNLKHIDLGPATELDFATESWTVSAWVKTTQPRPTGGDPDKGAIFANGADAGGGHRYTLLLNESNTGRVTLITDDNSTKYQDTRSDNNINNGFWHHIVGLRDSENNELRIYSDGILDDSQGISAGYDLSGTSQWNSYIGMISKADVEGGLYKHFDGLIDDVRVYNYAVPLDDATYESILKLTAMGEIAADCDAGPNVSLQLQPGEVITTEGTVTDLGLPGTLNLKWTTVSVTVDGVPVADANAIFVDDTAAVTEVTFPVFGVYVLQLAVEDVNLGVVTDTSTVTMTIISPTCADVETAGLLLAGDISGPEGTPDCRVDLYDIAAFAEQFGTCNDPQGVECADAWATP